MNDTNAIGEMPKYRCHKEVWALKIKDVVNEPGTANFFIHPEDERYLPIEVEYEYLKKHQPEAGGYYVVYKDGYKSYSPAEAFEEGYSRI